MIRGSLNNWREAPYNQWAFQNIRQLIPTASIQASDRKFHQGSLVSSDQINWITVADSSIAADTKQQLLQFLELSHSDVFLHWQAAGECLQWTAPHYERNLPHIIFSISKSITGMLAGILVGDGLLDPEQKVGQYLPHTHNVINKSIDARCAYEDCTVQQLLDMTVALDFTEDYLNPSGEYFRYRNATGWNPVDQTADTETLEPFLYTLVKADFPHGHAFNYKSPNTDLMGLLIERASGQPFAEYLSSRLWQPMGALTDGAITVDTAMLARAAGGMCVTADDLLLFGQLMLKGGVGTDKQVIPEAWIKDTLEQCNKNTWQRGDFASLLPEGSYRNYWYHTGNRDHCYCAIGIHGQWLYINPTSQSIIVKFSSQPAPLDELTDARCLEFFEQLTRS